MSEVSTEKSEQRSLMEAYVGKLAYNVCVF